VRRGLVALGEQAGRFDHDIDTEVLPRQLRRVAFRTNLDVVAIDDQVAACHADRARKLAVRGVVLGQVGIGLGIAEIVDRDDPDRVGAVVFVQRTQDVAADAAVAVDRDLDRHGVVLCKSRLGERPF